VLELRFGKAYYGFASNTLLKGVSVALRNDLKPPDITTWRSCESLAWAPSASPTSGALDAGVQIIVDALY
jgi:hypothetical protein